MSRLYRREHNRPPEEDGEYGRRGGRARDRARGPWILGLVIGSIALAAVLFLFVLPTRTYLAQQHSLSAEQARLGVFNSENGALSAQAQRLQTNAEIERIAQQQYGLVLPGQKDVVSLPAVAPSTPKPKPRPQRGLGYRLWHDVQFWN
ncbi:MAG: FtsB family cell division protein [Acidimicrobiales bacterium]